MEHKIRNLPTVAHNKKCFPSDFFAYSPKYGPSRGHSAVTRSAARRDWSLNRNNNKIDNSNYKSSINPFKININGSSAKCRSLSKHKIRPQSYRVK